MSDHSVASVYARALFTAAQEAQAVDRVRNDLGQFADALHASASLRSALFDPQVDRAAKQRVLLGLAADGEPLVLNTLRVMQAKGRLSLLGETREEFERLAAAAERTIDVEVISAVPLGAPAEAEIVERVELATGRRPRLSKRVDEAVMGGLVLRVGDMVLDASLKTRVEQLRAQMQRV